MAYDPSAGGVVLFASGSQGGALGPITAYLNETWTFSHGQWTEVRNGTGPSPRGGESVDYDASLGAMLLFGGSRCGFFAGAWDCPSFGDTWTFSSGSWVAPNASDAPTGRSLAAMAYDPQLNGSLLVGGQSGAAYYSDAWAYAGGSWTPLLSPLAPAPREGAGMVYDAADQTILLYGGYLHVGRPVGGVELYFNDTWTFQVGTPPSGLSVVSMQLSNGPAPVGSLNLIVGDILSATSVGYSFSGLPPGCLALDTDVLVCVPTSSGTYTVVLTVTDAHGSHASGSIVLVVGITPRGPPSSTPGSVNWMAILSGAAGAAIGAAAVAAAAYVRRRERDRERREGTAIARELENPHEPEHPIH